MMSYERNPNPYYYDAKGGIRHRFWEKGSNPKLADFGARNRLPCGGHWILGADFAFCIEYAASSYECMAYVSEFGPDSTDKWDELRTHLAMTNCWHTLKTRNEVADNLGLGALTSLVPERR